MGGVGGGGACRRGVWSVVVHQVVSIREREKESGARSRTCCANAASASRIAAAAEFLLVVAIAVRAVRSVAAASSLIVFERLLRVAQQSQQEWWHWTGWAQAPTPPLPPCTRAMARPREPTLPGATLAGWAASTLLNVAYVTASPPTRPWVPVPTPSPLACLLAVHATPTHPTMTINTDRALGAVLGSAAGDALGASYEFKPAVLPPKPIEWRAGGPWERGEWTDDTAMAIPLLDELAAGADLRTDASLGRVVLRWLGWSKGAKDVGIQTRRVFGALERQLDRQGIGAAAADSENTDTGHVARLCKVAAGQIHDVTGRSGGNGSLMRTGPVALGYLGTEGSAGAAATAAAARAQSDLTHFDADTGDACVLWSLAIRHAILTGEIDLYGQLSALPADRAELWRGRIKDAEGLEPHQIKNNGWVVAAFQAAWSAIVRGNSLVDVLERAVRAGDDTDTVAAIAGSLAGAKYGASALPKLWTDELHGWPSERAADLEAKVLLVVRKE